MSCCYISVLQVFSQPPNQESGIAATLLSLNRPLGTGGQRKAIKKMKKLILIGALCLMALTMNAQRCAVLDFKAGTGVSVADIDGISEIFGTYFRPAGYTMVERTQINKVITEQRFQQSSLTQEQMVRVGQILNVSKIVLGVITVWGGGYNVDVRIVDVQSGIDVAAEGATFTGDYRTAMKNLAQKLAGKIAITPGKTVQPTPAPAPRTRSSVEVLYGYLKIFPNELGVFQSEPTSVIRQINAQAQHGYNNWRIPTEEELSLMRANNYLGNGEYMSRESRHGIVLLVSDGKDYVTLQAEEMEQERQRQRAQQEAAEQERQRKAALKAQGLVDLGLPSGTLWKEKNESGFYDYESAVRAFGNKLPTKEQFEELKNLCQWIWIGSGYKVTGPSGESIVLPDESYYGYWSSGSDSSSAWRLDFSEDGVNMYDGIRSIPRSVRLVQD